MGKNNVLVVGSGGREHALAWKLRQSKKVGDIYVGPGNPGMEDVAEPVALNVENHRELSDFVRGNDVALTVVGPEDPLAGGIVDYWWKQGLVKEGHQIFGPTKAAARLESSKAFAKHFMTRNNIPTAGYRVFTSEKEATKYLRQRGDQPVVVKADGLAKGKGAIVCQGLEDALQAVDDMLVGNKFGKAGKKIVIEDFMPGEEASIFATVDGKRFRVLASSQDHKAAYEGDTGPNTGGMGAYAPAPLVTNKVMERIYDQILKPTVKGMRKEGTPFTGCLYAGLMIEDGQPRVVEYNVRFGDPETQVVLPLLKTDLFDLLMGSATGNLKKQKVTNYDGSATCVVMASEGYPGGYEKGKVISGLEDAAGRKKVTVFHAGTALKGDEMITNGGRVLGVTGVGKDLSKAVERAYKGVAEISWEGEYHRNDIAHRAFK